MRKEILLSFSRAIALSVITTGGLMLSACSSDDGGSGDIETDGGSDGGAAHDGSVVDSSTGHDATTAADTGGGNEDHDATTDSTLPDADHTGDATTADAADAADAAAAADAADAAVVDSAIPDVNVPDTAPAPVGSPCAPENSIQTEACGLCGSQQRVCLTSTDPDSGVAAPVWQQWGLCQNQPVNGCAPGTQSTESCGNCGHRLRVCQLDCSWAVGTCTGEPDNACTPGTTNYVAGLSCNTGGRRQTCTSTCTWGSFGACEGEFTAGALTISTTIAGVASVGQTLAATPVLKRLNTGTCPVSVGTTQTTFAYTVITNPTAQTAKVSVYGSKTATGNDIDTVLGVYSGSELPSTDASRAACLGSVNDTCTGTGSPCSGGFGGLVGTSAVTIPPNGSIVVYTAAYFTSTTGAFLVNARTESLN